MICCPRTTVGADWSFLRVAWGKNHSAGAGHVPESPSVPGENLVRRRPLDCGGLSLRSQPERRLGRLHGLVDYGQQIGGQGGQVDLVTQAGAEGLDDPGRVVAAAVEAPVHGLLDAAAGRLEGGGYGQGWRPPPQRGRSAYEQCVPEA